MTTDTPSLGEHRVDAAMSAAIDADASRTGRPGDCVDTDVIRNPDFRRAFAAAVIAEYVEEAANPSYVPYCPEVAASVAAVGKAVLDNTLRAATLDLYTPPFRYENGYVWDDNNHVVTDDGGEFVTGVIASRIRGWGRIQYMDKPRGRAAALQDDVGECVAAALNAYWEAARSTCPRCEGRGEVITALLPPAVATPGAYYATSYTSRCPSCRGTGKGTPPPHTSKDPS